MSELIVTWDKRIEARVTAAAMLRAVTYGGRDALRALRPAASRAVRARKALQVKVVNAGMTPRNPAKGTPLDRLVWVLRVSGKAVPLMDYPHRETSKGVWVTVNKGARQQLRHAFVARMWTGHVGIFERAQGAPRFPIRELFTTRISEPVGDVAPELLQHAQNTFTRTWERVLAAELRGVVQSSE